MHASGFRPRHELLDRLLLAHLKQHDPHVMDLASQEHERRVLFSELFTPQKELPGHYGQIARSAWVFTDQLFKPADAPSDSPPGAPAKAVQVADVFELVAPYGTRTAFLELWLEPGDEPVLVPFPEIPPVLLGKEDGTFGDCRRALHELLWQVTERLNAMLPLARWLAAGHQLSE